jgi:hypothetical protein
MPIGVPGKREEPLSTSSKALGRLRLEPAERAAAALLSAEVPSTSVNNVTNSTTKYSRMRRERNRKKDPTTNKAVLQLNHETVSTRTDAVAGVAGVAAAPGQLGHVGQVGQIQSGQLRPKNCCNTTTDTVATTVPTAELMDIN